MPHFHILAGGLVGAPPVLMAENLLTTGCFGIALLCWVAVFIYELVSVDVVIGDLSAILFCFLAVFCVAGVRS